MADAHETTEIDRGDEPYRWRCPNGHSSWDRTNNHVHCPSCRRALENDSWLKVQEAEHWEIVDAKTGERIPYSAVEFEDSE